MEKGDYALAQANYVRQQFDAAKGNYDNLNERLNAIELLLRNALYFEETV